LADDVDQATLMRTIAELNSDPRTDAVLVQLPLPGHLDAAPVLEAIDPPRTSTGSIPSTSVASGRVGRRWRPAHRSACWPSSTTTGSTCMGGTW
jgi:hypothetical protein